jgi:hypothetical protein
MDSSTIISRVIASLISIMQASNLRNRLYLQEQRIEKMQVALSDIQRINANSTAPNILIGGIIERIKGSEVLPDSGCP